jgi:hypothetical protein
LGDDNASFDGKSTSRGASWFDDSFPFLADERFAASFGQIVAFRGRLASNSMMAVSRSSSTG